MFLTHVRDSRARQKEDDQKHKWKIPRVIGMRNSGGRSGSDARWRQRLLAPGPVHKGRNRRHGNDGLHDATRLRFLGLREGLLVFRSEAVRLRACEAVRDQMWLGGCQVSCELIASALYFGAFLGIFGHFGAARLSAAAAKVTCTLRLLALLLPGSPSIGHVRVPGIGN